MVDWQGTVIAGMSDVEFTQYHFPMLHDGLLRDQDVFVHSLGCSVWNTLGHELGFMAVVECPAPSSHGADIRSDSGWFHKGEPVPACLVEFERFDGNNRSQLKLEEKLQNLLEAAQRWENAPDLLVLSAWSKGIVSTPNIQKLQQICQQGFTTNSGIKVSASRNAQVILNRFLFQTSDNGGSLKLCRLRCTELK